MFLLAHFYILSKALTQPETLEQFLHFAENPMIKVAEFGLAVHMFGGLRLMAMDWLPWSDKQKTLTVVAVAVSFLISGTFFLQAI